MTTLNSDQQMEMSPLMKVMNFPKPKVFICPLRMT